jgi:hypothetical protein
MRSLSTLALALFLSVALGASSVLAQQGPSWFGPSGPSVSSDQPMDPPPPPPPPPPVPVDGALALLALAGGAYAVRRLRQVPS